MKRLYLLRHGLAVAHGTPGYEEDERPLTPKGERRMRKIARGLERLKVRPDRVISSPLPRAFRTAELAVEGPVETADTLRAGADASAIRDWILQLRAEEPMIVGHNPWISELVALLPLGEALPLGVDLGKGGVAAFDVPESECFRLDWIATPRMLRKLGS